VHGRGRVEKKERRVERARERQRLRAADDRRAAGIVRVNVFGPRLVVPLRSVDLGRGVRLERAPDLRVASNAGRRVEEKDGLAVAAALDRIQRPRAEAERVVLRGEPLFDLSVGPREPVVARDAPAGGAIPRDAACEPWRATSLRSSAATSERSDAGPSSWDGPPRDSDTVMAVPDDAWDQRRGQQDGS